MMHTCPAPNSCAGSAVEDTPGCVVSCQIDCVPQKEQAIKNQQSVKYTCVTGSERSSNL
jgi:hypothetical protein